MPLNLLINDVMKLYRLDVQTTQKIVKHSNLILSTHSPQSNPDVNLKQTKSWQIDNQLYNEN